MSRPPKTRHTYQPGDVVKDRYGIQRMIAAGGMGEVYEVIDAQTANGAR